MSQPDRGTDWGTGFRLDSSVPGHRSQELGWCLQSLKRIRTIKSWIENKKQDFLSTYLFCEEHSVILRTKSSTSEKRCFTIPIQQTFCSSRVFFISIQQQVNNISTFKTRESDRALGALVSCCQVEKVGECPGRTWFLVWYVTSCWTVVPSQNINYVNVNVISRAVAQKSCSYSKSCITSVGVTSTLLLIYILT